MGWKEALKRLFTCGQCGSQSGQKTMTLAVVGLDNAGKSTLLANVRGESPAATVPTWGFINKDWRMGSWNIMFYDLGGARKIRKIWERYYAEIHGLVFVVDASDEGRLDEVRPELEGALRHRYMAQKTVLVFANKQDKELALDPAEVASRLGLDATETEACKVVGCSGIYAEGETPDGAILEGVLWLIGSIERRFHELDARVREEAEAQMALEKRLKAERKVRADESRAERSRNEAYVHPEPQPGNSTAPTTQHQVRSPIDAPAGDTQEAKCVVPSGIFVDVPSEPTANSAVGGVETRNDTADAGFDGSHPFALESAPTESGARPRSRGSENGRAKKYVLTEEVELSQGRGVIECC